MNPIAAQQVALDNALVAPESRLKIEKCNARIKFSKPQREETYQVTLDALKLSPCYPAFSINAEVPEVYMHHFWNTIKKIKDTYAYWFKLDKKMFRSETKVYREILQIYPRLPNQDFVEPPFEKEMVPIIQELSYSRKRDMLSTIHTDQMHQLWRTFPAIINRCISRKSTANREISSERKEIMPYPRLTKVIINHFISKDKTISMRNQIDLHTIWEDTLLSILKFVSKTQDYQQYGALILEEMINQDIKDSKAYKTYLAFAIGQATPKKARKFKKIASPSEKLYHVLEEEEPTKNPKKITSFMQVAQVMELVPNQRFLMSLKTRQLGNSEDDDTDDFSNDDEDDVDSDADGDNEASDSEKTNFDEDENPNLNQNDDDDEKEYKEEYVHTPDNYEL
uniref:Uncharacterized protein n=1 Tax=Tanacetum cinerariifolium TaxID=118510 RepID=A0A699JDC7_TANCI|nr:hypothetical protein [Tanacetum cinerariifolium]